MSDRKSRTGNGLAAKIPDDDIVLAGRRLSLPRIVKALAEDRRGVIVVMFALMLPILIGFIGLGIEVGLWYTERRDLQAAADAGALAGAYELAEDRASNIGTVAQREAENNGWSTGSGTVTVRSFPFNGSYPAAPSAFSADPDTVQVELTRQVSLLFAGYFLGSGGEITINTKAVGKSVAGANEACVLALGSGNPSGALTATGAANIIMSGCTAATNSTSDSALTVSGAAGLTVDCAYSSGGVSATPGLNTTQCSGAKENQPAVTDPYADSVTEPAASDFDSCTTYTQPSPPADDSINPGAYCGIAYNANGKTLTMAAGTYYIDRGDFTVSSSNTTINASAGVTVVFGDSTGSGDCGDLNITGQATINITAPTSGNFAGIAFYRGPGCDAGTGANLAGGSASNFVGAVYMPSSSLTYTGNSALGGTCVQLIADTITFTGSGTIGTACAGTGVKDILAGGKGLLVE